MTASCHRYRKRLFLSCLSLIQLSAYSTALSGEVHRLGFKEAIKIGLKNSREVDSAERDLRIAQLSTKSAFAGYFPKFGFDSTHGIKDQNPRPSEQKTPWSSEFRLGLTQSLYDNGQTQWQNETSRLKAQLAELNLTRRREEKVHDLGLKYLSYILATKKLELQKEQNKIIRDQYASIENNYRMGLKPRNDFMRIEIQARRADLALISAQTSADQSLQDLRDAIGSDLQNQEDQSLYEFDAQLPASSAEEMAAVGPIKDDELYSFRVRSLQQQIDQLEYKTVARKNWPEVAVNAGVNWGSQDYIGTGSRFEENDATRWYALLSIQYTIWDWGIRRNDVLAAAEKKAMSENTYWMAIKAQKAEVSQILNDYARARMQSKLMSDLLKLEEENHRLVDRDYKNGIAKYLDLMSVLDNLADAKNGFFMAKYELERAIWNHRFHAGGIYEFVARD